MLYSLLLYWSTLSHFSWSSLGNIVRNNISIENYFTLVTICPHDFD